MFSKGNKTRQATPEEAEPLLTEWRKKQAAAVAGRAGRSKDAKAKAKGGVSPAADAPAKGEEGEVEGQESGAASIGASGASGASPKAEGEGVKGARKGGDVPASLKDGSGGGPLTGGNVSARLRSRRKKYRRLAAKQEQLVIQQQRKEEEQQQGGGDDVAESKTGLGDGKEEEEEGKEGKEGKEVKDVKKGEEQDAGSAAAEPSSTSTSASPTPPYWTFRVLFSKGATIRDGVDIDASEVVGNMAKGTETIATARVLTPDGIPRLLTPLGWISQRLRGGAEEEVVEVLRHVPCPQRPLQYRIVCPGGAMVRETAELDGAERGGAPNGTVVSVSERLRLEDGTMRLRVAAPEDCVGWISEKDHIVRRVVSPAEEEDGSRQAEALRRAAVRSRRSKRQQMERRQEAQEAQEEAAAVEVTVKGTFEACSSCFFLMNRRHAGPGIRLSADLATATCRSGGTRTMVLGSRGFKSGVHYWEVRVDQCNWGSMFIGVSPKPREGRAVPLGSWSGHGFLNYRACQAYGSETMYGAYYKGGDRVGVLLDMDRGTLSFLLDGEDFSVGRHVVAPLGIAYHHLRRMAREGTSSLGAALYPCFGMKSSGDQMSVDGGRWLSQRGRHHAAKMADMLEAMVTLQHAKRCQALGLDGLPRHCSRAVKRRARAALEGRGRRSNSKPFLSRAGLEVLVDVSQEKLTEVAGRVCAPFAAVQVGHPITTPYGSGRIIGTRKGMVWWVQEGHKGGQGQGEDSEAAWYWTLQSLEVALHSAQVVLKEYSKEGPKEDVKEEGEKDTEGQSKESGSSVEAPLSTSASAEAYGASAEAYGASTSSLPPLPSSPLRSSSEADWERLFSDTGWCQDAQALDEALVGLANTLSNRKGEPGGVAHIGEDELHRGAQSWPSLAGFSRQTLSARLQLLLELNRSVAMALPAVDLARASESPLTLTSADVRAVHLGLGQLAVPLGVLSSVGAALSSLRGLLLTQTKTRHWALLLRETTTATAPNADEYERPEALPEVELNRMKARAAALEGEGMAFQGKLQASLFGQLYHQLAGLDSASLRRSFVHMQDAGQARAFYVKFRGEGVDDHGGPYRAVFGTAVAEEPAGLLELLLPCPNGKNRSGRNQDRLVFAPQLRDEEEGLQQRRLLLWHLGRLLGVAGRHKIHVPLSLPLGLTWRALVGLPLEGGALDDVDSALYRGLADVEKGRMEAEEARELLEDVVEEEQSAADADIARAAAEIRGRLHREPPGSLVPAVRNLRLAGGNWCLEALYSGLAQALPVELLALFTPEEAEALFCGQIDVDVDLLQKVTEYEDGVSPSEPHVQFLWEVLREMSADDKGRFVNFCSGRSRLPTCAADFTMNFKLTNPLGKGGEKGQKEDGSGGNVADDYLPVAQTCFFSLALPRYSSKEVCRAKLQYAIRNAPLMDADFLVRSAEGWDEIK